MANKDMLTLELNLTLRHRRELKEIIKPADVEVLATRLDNWMFGGKGSLVRAIKAQSRAGESWKPLSEKYVAWKVRMRKSRKPIPHEFPPNTVISEKIWIRTGKVREFCETTGDGTFKKMRIWPNNLFSHRPFYEVFIKHAVYWKFADEKRRLFVFTADDQAKMQGIFGEWLKKLVVAAFSNRKARAAV